jgi:hypothetical protein
VVPLERLENGYGRIDVRHLRTEVRTAEPRLPKGSDVDPPEAESSTRKRLPAKVGRWPASLVKRSGSKRRKATAKTV